MALQVEEIRSQTNRYDPLQDLSYCLCNLIQFCLLHYCKPKEGATYVLRSLQTFSSTAVIDTLCTAAVATSAPATKFSRSITNGFEDVI
ncbi:MAG: hypothetical protein WA137_11815 [Methanothrix sp.]